MISDLLAKLDGVQGRGPRWRAICPAHESKHGTRSLAIREESDGRILLHCFAGCGVADVVGAIGMDLSDLFPPNEIENAPRIKKPWSARDVAQALENETLICWILLSDIAHGKVITKTDRERAKLAADRAAHLMRELANAA